MIDPTTANPPPNPADRNKIFFQLSIDQNANTTHMRLWTFYASMALSTIMFGWNTRDFEGVVWTYACSDN
jgi:hypothetical protein